MLSVSVYKQIKDMTIKFTGCRLICGGFFFFKSIREQMHIEIKITKLQHKCLLK